MSELTFQPKLESKEAKVYKVDPHVSELTLKSGNTYIERQLKAKREKQAKNEKLVWRPTKGKKSPLLSLSQDKLLTFPGSPTNNSEQKTANEGEDEEEGEREVGAAPQFRCV